MQNCGITLKLQLSRTFLCKLLISNSMVSREIWINMHFEVFEKLTRACYIQIALETMLLPVQIRYFF
jgi:hypothetical protein